MTGEDDAADESRSRERPSPIDHEVPLHRLPASSSIPTAIPAIAPPWGTLNAIDLNTGEYAWKIPLGEYPELAAKGLKNTGTENYGGPIVTAGGLVFIGATNHDRKFRAFDKATGRAAVGDDAAVLGQRDAGDLRGRRAPVRRDRGRRRRIARPVRRRLRRVRAAENTLMDVGATADGSSQRSQRPLRSQREHACIK